MKSLTLKQTTCLALFAGSALTMAATMPAAALSNVSQGDALGTEIVEIVAALEAMDLTIEEVEREDGMIEVYVTTPEGLFEIEIDAETGLVAEIEAEEEDDDEDLDDDDEDEDEDEDEDSDSDNG